MKVQVIEATKTPSCLATGTHSTYDKLRVAAYCRVSTNSDEQESSFEAQVRHYTDYINSNSAWTLVGIYADEGMSGTTTRHREHFNAMMSDCEAGRIDIIITKSISRWARNTVDSLVSIRKLRDLGVSVIFEKEGIDTMDAQGEVLITIMSSIAQQESESISKNVRMGIQYRMQQGKGRLNTSRFSGFVKDPQTGELQIVPSEAAIVRWIYRSYLDGYSPAMIAKRLTSKEYPAPAGGDVWHASTVTSILHNEKYCGDLLLQKYYVTDFLSHRIARNIGQLPQYFVEKHHDPIVPKEVWLQVQDEAFRRSTYRYDPSRIRFGSERALEGRLVCDSCGKVLKRRMLASNGDALWQCCIRVVSEIDAKQAIVTAINRALGMREDLVLKHDALRKVAASCDDRLKRAHAANQAMRVRGFLELIDAAYGLHDDQHFAKKEPVAACHECEGFFYLTRYIPPQGALAVDGAVVAFLDDMATRFLDHVVVLSDAYDVHLKCGLILRAY